MFDRCYKITNTWKGFHNDLENLTKTLNKNQVPTKHINKVTKQYLNLKFDKKSFGNKTEVKTDTRFTLANIPTLLKKRFKILLKLFVEIWMLKLYLHHSRSVTSFHIKIHYHFIFNRLSFKNLFVQTVRFAMRMKPQGTSSPESMNTYRKTLSSTSLNICKNHVYVIVCAIRIVFQ